MSANWIWSAPHSNYYRNEYINGKWVITWNDSEKPSFTNNQRSDSDNFTKTFHRTTGASVTQPYAPLFHANPTSNPSALLQNQPSFSDTQSHGQGMAFHEYFYPVGAKFYETLDSTFYVRTRSFFDVGRVFAVLFTEDAGQTVSAYTTSISTVRFNEQVHTQIRRFVVVRPKNEFCYACPIFTYGGRATSKPGVRAEEHTIIYTEGSSPQLLPGEVGITKKPIRVVQDPVIPPLDAASRLYFGIHHPIQYNVKVKDLGCVAKTDLIRLRSYWTMSNHVTSSQDMTTSMERTNMSTISISTTDMSTSDMEMSGEEDASDEDSSDKEAGNGEITNMQTPGLIESVVQQVVDLSDTTDDSHVSAAAHRSPESNLPLERNVSPFVPRSEPVKAAGHPDSGYAFVSNPKAFFKKGRVFMTLWAEPRGYSQAEKETDKMVGQAFTQIARFAVVRTRGTHCLCLRIRTYSGQATTKPGTVIQDHAAVVSVGGEVQLHPREELLTKMPICVKVEDASLSIDPMSRMNFTKVYTVEYNLKIRNIGRVFGESVGIMDEYFAAGLGFTKAQC